MDRRLKPKAIVSTEAIGTVVVERKNRTIFEDGLEIGQAERFQGGDEALQFGFSWRLRELLAPSVGSRNGREGCPCTGYICISFSSSSSSWLLLQPEKGARGLLVWSRVAALLHLLFASGFASICSALGPCMGRSVEAKVSVQGRFVCSTFCPVVSCYSMGLQWLPSLWLVLEYMQLGSLGLHFTEVPSATSAHKQPRQALGGAGSVCSAEQRRERG